MNFISFGLIFRKVNDPFKNAVFFFKNDVILTESRLTGMLEMFDNVYKMYSHYLRNSILDLIGTTLPRTKHPLYYNYIICNGTKLNYFLKQFRSNCIVNEEIRTHHVHEFIGYCLYAGKGINQRMISHLINGKKIVLEFNVTDLNAKYSEIIKVWENGEGIAIVRLFAEINHYEALSRENALIHALGLKNITNKINGTCYGIMKHGWNKTEITNFGTMMLYSTLKMLVMEPPPVLMEADIV